ncbi:Alpha/Beta hydrolase protein [Fimicolochytrium jonesii]|uniref:Alpha/Beta hydrolase protein n=1 Tax=Fimicolochytrium jonesii TaxID=1396493 RepID=UPI0022FEE053|nr:Alpha/Beta hydrolase protein [Fimicolochytrium jonesii]KAI8819386.1 Alpha/Beta hydrolase protein [Fimicolochytrium jonesii]
MIANLQPAAINAVIQKEVAKSRQDPTTSVPPTEQLPVNETANGPTNSLQKLIAIGGDDLKNAELYQLYSAAAYCLNGLDGWICKDRCAGGTLGTKLISKFVDSKTDTVGYVAVNPSRKEIIVAFRGTSSITNAINDLKFFKADANVGLSRLRAPDGAKVHIGFQSTVTASRSAVRAAIQKAFQQYGTDYTITVTGHSLGGATSVLTAIDIVDWLGDSAGKTLKLYTYGEPRVGNSIFANWVSTLPFASHVYRITHTTDIVPHLPPKSFGFQHHREEFWISKNGDLNSCNDANGEDPQCAGSVFIPTIDAHLNGYFSMPFGPWC